MKTAIFLVFMLSLVSGTAESSPLRVYCKPDGVVFEKSLPDVPFTEESLLFHDVKTIIIDEGEVPSFKYREQLRCDGEKLILDASIKTTYILEQEMKSSQLKQAQAALDAELGKADPDVITVLRLQRTIEQIKKAN